MKTEGSDLAKAWFATLLTHMGIEGTVKASGTEERVQLHLRVDRPGRVVGKRGATLSSIRHLLRLMLTPHGDPVIDVEVDGTEDRKGGRKHEKRSGRDRDRGGRDRDRGGRGDRDRGGRGGRGGRDRDRGGRDRDRGGRDRDDNRNRMDSDKIKALARRAAEKAIETGKTVTINVELNSYDRRLVHVTVADVAGASTQSEQRDGKKYVQVIPE